MPQPAPISLGAAILLGALTACAPSSRVVDRADYADGDPVAFSRTPQPYALADGTYVYDLVADGDGFDLLADWTDTTREPASIGGILHLDPTTGVVTDVSDALELVAPSEGGILARTDGPLVVVIDEPFTVPRFAAVYTLDGGISSRFAVPMEKAYAAAVSEGQLYIAGMDRDPCDGWRDWCPRLWTWDLATGASRELSYPDVNQAVALQPTEDGVELLSEEAFGRYHRSTDSWETTTLPEYLNGFTRLSDTERLFFRGEGRDNSQPVVLDLESETWREGNFDDHTLAPVRLQGDLDGQTWVIDSWYAGDGVTPTLSVVTEE